MYYCMIQMIWSSIGSASGTIVVSLPASIGASWVRCAGYAGYCSGVIFVNQLVLTGSSGGTTLSFLDLGAAGAAPATLTNANFASAGEIDLNFMFSSV